MPFPFLCGILRCTDHHSIGPAFSKTFVLIGPHTKITYVDFIRDDFCRRVGDASWFRLTERWTAGAKSVFRFDVQGAVAKSTHAGLPWASLPS